MALNVGSDAGESSEDFDGRTSVPRRTYVTDHAVAMIFEVA